MCIRDSFASSPLLRDRGDASSAPYTVASWRKVISPRPDEKDARAMPPRRGARPVERATTCADQPGSAEVSASALVEERRMEKNAGAPRNATHEDPPEAERRAPGDSPAVARRAGDKVRPAELDEECGGDVDEEDQALRSRRVSLGTSSASRPGRRRWGRNKGVKSAPLVSRPCPRGPMLHSG